MLNRRICTPCNSDSTGGATWRNSAQRGYASHLVCSFETVDTLVLHCDHQVVTQFLNSDACKNEICNDDDEFFEESEVERETVVSTVSGVVSNSCT